MHFQLIIPLSQHSSFTRSDNKLQVDVAVVRLRKLPACPRYPTAPVAPVAPAGPTGPIGPVYPNSPTQITHLATHWMQHFLRKDAM